MSNGTTDHTIDQDNCLACQEERKAPKPVENGELLTINNLITKWAQIVGVKDGFSYVVKILIDPADGFADDAFSSNLRYELEAYLAQEKAKWVAEVVSVIPKERNTDVGDAYQRTFCGEYNKALKDVRQALAKLLDKEQSDE